MELYDTALPYWLICRRFNHYKQTNPAMRSAAVFDMGRLRQHTKSDAVIRRVNSFISRNQPSLTPKHLA